MKCRSLQNLLLGADNPARPSAEALAHLAQCPSCRAWQQRLARVEAHVSLLPVPPSTGRDAFVQAFVVQPVLRIGDSKGLVKDSPSSAAGTDPQRMLHARLPTNRWWIAAGVAAFLLGALAGPALREPREDPQAKSVPNSPEPRDLLLAGVLRHNVRLAAAAKPRERVEILAELADDVHQETQTLARTAESDDLLKLAELYEAVVRVGLVQRAQDLPPDQRRAVLEPIVRRLDHVRSQAEAMAENVPAVAEPLRLVAAAARDGEHQLGALTRMETNSGGQPVVEPDALARATNVLAGASGSHQREVRP